MKISLSRAFDVQRYGPQQAGWKKCAGASTGRERVTAGLVLPTAQEAGIPLDGSDILVWRLLVAEHAVRPAVGHLDLELIVACLDGVGDINSPRRAPDDAEVLSVETDAGHIVNRAQVEVDCRIWLLVRGTVEVLSIGCDARVELDTPFLTPGPILQVIEGDLFRAAPLGNAVKHF
jgi:hypothetical protein